MFLPSNWKLLFSRSYICFPTGQPEYGTSLKIQPDTVRWLFGFEGTLIQTTYLLYDVTEEEAVSEGAVSSCDSGSGAKHFDAVPYLLLKRFPTVLSCLGRSERFKAKSLNALLDTPGT